MHTVIGSDQPTSTSYTQTSTTTTTSNSPPRTTTSEPYSTRKTLFFFLFSQIFIAWPTDNIGGSCENSETDCEPGWFCNMDFEFSGNCECKFYFNLTLFMDRYDS